MNTIRLPVALVLLLAGAVDAGEPSASGETRGPAASRDDGAIYREQIPNRATHPGSAETLSPRSRLESGYGRGYGSRGREGADYNPVARGGGRQR